MRTVAAMLEKNISVLDHVYSQTMAIVPHGMRTPHFGNRVRKGVCNGGLILLLQTPLQNRRHMTI